MARGGRVARRDGLDDGAVLVLHRLHEVEPARLVAARDAHAFAQVLLEKAEQQPELRVAGGFADHAVEGHVFGHAVVARRGRHVDGLQRPAQVRDLAAARALGGQRANLAFEHATHLDHVHHGLHRLEHGRIERQRTVERRLRHEHARTLARDHQRLRLELMHGLAHHGAGDAVRGGELLLGGKPVAGAQGAGFDLRGQPRSEPVRQAVRHQAEWF